MKRPSGGDVREVFLPEHLVEGIVARIPYPSIYKARVLSKSWLKKFLPITFLDDEADKTLATSFQKTVSELSKDWPRGVFKASILWGLQISVSYELISHKKVIFPSVGFLSKEVSITTWPIVCRNGILVRVSKNIVYIANIFNQSSKTLCPRPEGRLRKNVPSILVSNKSSTTYKLIVFCKSVSERRVFYEVSEPWVVQIYDSKSAAWTSETVLGSELVGPIDYPAYLDGFLYMVQSVGQGMGRILKINVGKGNSTEELTLANADEHFGLAHSLVVCNAELFMVVRLRNYTREVILLKVDLVLLQVWKVAGSRRDLPNGKPYSYGNSIFFPGIHCTHAYNVTEREWSVHTKPVTTELVCGENFQVLMDQGSNYFLAV